MASKNRKCICCQEKYDYCPTCSRKDALEPSWKAEFCSEICKDLWLTLTKFGMGMLSASEAKSIISSLNLKPIDVYVECVKRDYAKVIAEEKKSRRIKRPEPIIDVLVEPIEQQVIEVAEHEVVKEENE